MIANCTVTHGSQNYGRRHLTEDQIEALERAGFKVQVTSMGGMSAPLDAREFFLVFGVDSPESF